MKKHNFKKMKIWLHAIEICDIIFKITSSFPKVEVYNLTSQINRSAVSIPSNIAEGSSRSSNKEFRRFLEILLGALFELQTQVIVACNRKYINTKKLKT